MKIALVAIVLLAVIVGTFLVLKFGGMKKTTVVNDDQKSMAISIGDITANKLMGGQEVKMSDYEGHPVLIVNTASKCGLTPQYKDLQALHEEYKDKGLKVVGFPCNDFMKQEPGDSKDIAEFCQMNYGVDFDMFQKIHVKGAEKHPVYQFLTEKEKNGVVDSEVQWNFQKYLLDKEGKLVAVFNPKVSVNEAEVRTKIDSLL